MKQLSRQLSDEKSQVKILLTYVFFSVWLEGMYNLTLTGWRVNKTLLNYCQNRLKQITLFQKRSFKGAETITCFDVCLILFKGSHISWHRGLHCKLPPFTINNSDVQNMHERFVSFLKRILKVMDFISLLSILYHYDIGMRRQCNRY